MFYKKLFFLVSYLSFPEICFALTTPMDQHWPGGFQGKVTLQVNSRLDGWVAHLIFNTPVTELQVPQGTIQKIGDREFVLHSNNWDAHIAAGGQLVLEIVGYVAGHADIAHITACAYIEGVGSNDCVTTTTSTTTTTTTPRTTSTTPTTTTTTTTTTTPTTTTTTPTTTTTTPTTTTTTTPTTTTTTPTTTTPTTTTTTTPTTTTATSATVTTTAPTTAQTTTATLTTTFPTPTTSSPSINKTSTTIETTVKSTTTRATTTTVPMIGHTTKNYAEALRLSLLFYDAQRSGKLPADNPIPWRGDSALNDCVVGGWYDAGDHVKFGFPMAGALTMLLWGVDRFKDGYQAAGQLDKMYDTVRWGLDYLIHAWDPFKQELVVQIGDGETDHQFWGRPEDMNMSRVCIKIGPDRPGSDVAGETAAALAAGAVVFKRKGDYDFAETLLKVAESVYDFAKLYRSRFSDNPPVTNEWGYKSSSDKDELCEAGVWLYRATGEDDYLTDAKFEFRPIVDDEYSWDKKMAACQLLLYEATANDVYREAVEQFLQGWQTGGHVVYTPCGLAWSNDTAWGATRHVANVAFLALLASQDGIGGAVYSKWAAEQINYLLGDNPHDGGCFSYEIGYGNKYPLQPHHRAASCPDPPAQCTEDNLHVDAPSPHILYGGLVGGPIYNDGYNDTREDYVHNEVALDYNAGFQSALAGLVHLALTGSLPATENKCPCTQ